MKRSSPIAIAWLVLCLAAFGNPPPSVSKAMKQIEQAAGGAVDADFSETTGLATFISPRAKRWITINVPANAAATERALGFVSVHGAAIGIKDKGDLRIKKVRELDQVGMDHVRFQQLHKGIPVTAGEVTVHLRGGKVVAVNAKTLPDLDNIDVTPQVRPAEALAQANEFVAERFHIKDAVLGQPRLEIFNRGQLEGTQRPTRLAWFVEAKKFGFREFIWVDAQQGGVLLHFSQLPHALYREVYDADNSSSLPGTLARKEGQPPTGNAEVDTAYNMAGMVYNYYQTYHGRDSYDGSGATLISTVDYRPPGSVGSYANAFWDGTQIVYGQGFANADDIVAHELTHAVTEHEAGLYYYMQSGALNESFSDIFGETADLLNGIGNDSASVRWLIGEDLSSGAFRNMMNPPQFGDPAKLSSPEYICTESDDGGVHKNSGVPNHAYALMVDGGTYNGFTISGIGLIKAAKIQYRALTTYVLSGSGFRDYYNAVKQSALDLMGTAGITAADVIEVTKALDAVELSAPSRCSSATPVPLVPCGPDMAIANLFFDDLEDVQSGNWTSASLSGDFNHWDSCDGVPDIYCTNCATSGTHNFAGGGFSIQADAVITLAHDIHIPAAGAYLQFNHSYSFQHSDSVFHGGGVVEYSTNQGSTWLDGGALISAGATYGGTIVTTNGNPLAGRSAFVGESFGYTSTRMDLSALAGCDFRFQFHVGTSTNAIAPGWAIDDIQVFQCITSAMPPTISLQPTGLTNWIGGNAGFIVVAAGSPPPAFQWQKDSVNLVNDGRISGVTSSALAITGLLPSDAGQYSVVITNSGGCVTSSNAPLAMVEGRLSLTPANDGLQISWPVSAANIVLESCTDLAMRNWRTVTNVPAVQDGQNILRLPAAGTEQYYRLKEVNP